MDNLWSNIFANIVSTIIIALLAWVLPLLFLIPPIYLRRLRLFRFFGITKQRNKIKVYFSSVYVLPGGSADFNGITRSFSGPATPSGELSIMQSVSDLFKEPLLDGLPKPIKEWLGKRIWLLSNISPTFGGSPATRSKIENSNIITIGSQYYNTVTDYYTETCSPILKMIINQNNQAIIRVTRGKRQNDIFTPRPQLDDDLGIIEKTTDKASGNTIFITAGLGVFGTISSVHFLCNNWNKLYKEFGAKTFAICIRIQNITTDPNAVKKPVELSRFQE